MEKSRKWRSAMLTIIVFILQHIAYDGQAQYKQQTDSLLHTYQSQPEDSSKAETLNHLFQAYLYNNAAKAREYAIEQLTLSKRINYKKGVAQGYQNLGVYFSNTEGLDSCRWYYQKALSLYRELGLTDRVAKTNYGLAIVESYSGNFDASLAILDTVINLYRLELKDSVALGVAYTLVGTVNWRKGNLKIALQAVLKAVAILEKYNDMIRLADAYGQLGSIEAILGNREKSIQHNLKALSIYEQNNDKFFAAQALNDIGLCYFYLKNYQQALEYLRRSIALSRSMGGADLEATSLTNIGKTYGDLGRYDSAAMYLHAGLALAEKTRITVKVVEGLNELGNLYLLMEQPRVAITFFDRAIPIAENIELKEAMSMAYMNRSMAYALLNQYSEALDDHRSYTAVKDSMFNESKSQQIEELRTIFDTEKKEQEIALQKNRIALLEQTAKVSRLQNFLQVSVLALVVLALGAGVNALNLKVKQNRLEKEKLDAELTFKRKELTTQALQLAKKNETLENLKQKAIKLRELDQSSGGYQQLIRTINSDLQDDRNWENFVRFFEDVHKGFNSTAIKKYPEITPNEIRLMALIRMSLSTKEIANILNISVPGVKKARQRLRKKMNLPSEESLENAILDL
jgi:tetratricopeptide (TPR) repeat protein